MQSKKLLGVLVTALATNAAWAELPDALKSMKALEVKLETKKIATTQSTPPDENKTPPKLPWEAANSTSPSFPKQPGADEGKSAAEKPIKKPSVTPKVDSAVTRIDQSMHGFNKPKKPSPTPSVLDIALTPQDASWSMRMARANEDQLLLEQQLKNADLRKKLEAAAPLRSNHVASVIPVLDVLPVVRAVEISSTRAMVTAEFEGSTAFARVGGTVGKWRVESIKVNAVTFNDGKKSITLPVVFQMQTAQVGQATQSAQPFLNAPSAVPPPPRINGGAR